MGLWQYLVFSLYSAMMFRCHMSCPAWLWPYYVIPMWWILILLDDLWDVNLYHVLDVWVDAYCYPVLVTCWRGLTRQMSEMKDLGSGERGRRMNSKVKIRQTRRGLMCNENKHSNQLAQSQYVPVRPLLAPLYRWPGLEEPVGFNINYNVCIRCHLVFRLYLCLGLF
jgi:hypothetical protein